MSRQRGGQDPAAAEPPLDVAGLDVVTLRWVADELLAWDLSRQAAGARPLTFLDAVVLVQLRADANERGAQAGAEYRPAHRAGGRGRRRGRRGRQAAG